MLKSFFVLLFCALALATGVYAQEQTETAAESLEKLRAQLSEVQAKEEGFRARAQQLEESLKPENIERSLAGVGSTRPEELRESRRRQLTIERDGVLAQLRLLESSRLRLETAIANAEGRAYHQSARPAPSAGNQLLSTSSGSSYRWLLFGGSGIAAVALAGGVLFYRRRIRLR